MRLTRVHILCVVCAVPQEVWGIRAVPGHVPVCQGAHGGQGGYCSAHLAFGCVHLRRSLTVSMRDNIACDVLSGICFRAVKTIGGKHLPNTLLPLPLPLPSAHTETRVFHPPPPGEPRGQPCVIESVDPGPTPPPTACSLSPPLPTFSSSPASASLPPLAPPMAHAPLAAPMPSVPPPPVFAGPSMARPSMACPPMAPPPPSPMLPRPQLVVPYPPHTHTHTHLSQNSHSHSNPYAFHPVPDAQPWGLPLDLLPVSQLPPPQAVPPRVDMPADEMQTLWEVRGHVERWRCVYIYVYLCVNVCMCVGVSLSLPSCRDLCGDATCGRCLEARASVPGQKRR